MCASTAGNGWKWKGSSLQLTIDMPTKVWPKLLKYLRLANLHFLLCWLATGLSSHKSSATLRWLKCMWYVHFSPQSGHLQMDNIPQNIIIKVVTSDPAEPYSLSRRFKVERLIMISLRISRKSRMTSYSYPWWKCISISTRTSLALAAILCLWTFNQNWSALRLLPSPSVVALWLFCLRCDFFVCVAAYFCLNFVFFFRVSHGFFLAV